MTSLYDAEIRQDTTDVVILGGGLAGLRAAIAARKEGCNVTIIYLARGSSPLVIGINVPLGDNEWRDSADLYSADMIQGGYGLNDARLVGKLAVEIVPAFRDLCSLGIPFAHDGEQILLRHLSGNSCPRSVYIAEGAGRVIRERLLAKARELGARILHGWRVIALLRDGDTVAGALAVRAKTKEFLAMRAGGTVLAMGGIGRLYEDSTYPVDIGADAYALAYEAGATLLDMEFVQFEPVVTTWPAACKGLEMPTAMLGDGAQLRNARGDRFMLHYNPKYGETRIEKAKLSLCIQREIDEGRGLADDSILFDTRTVPHEKLESYISHCKRLRLAGLDPSKAGPHVRPAAHSEMGGVSIDENGWSGIPGLYAAGEAAGGVHGASRLAGNGGSDSIVFGAVAGRSAARGLVSLRRNNWSTVVEAATDRIRALARLGGRRRPLELREAIRRVVANSAGLYRDATGLSDGLRLLEDVQHELSSGSCTPMLPEAINALSACNAALVGQVILTAALKRAESRGAHQRRDFPKQDDAHWLKHITCRKGPNGTLRMAVQAIC